MQALYRVIALVVCVAAAMSAGTPAAQDFPSKPVRMIVPSPAGSPPDLRARELGDRLARLFRRAVFVDNKPGANGAIGMEAGARSEPDGHTLVFSPFTPVTVSPSMVEHLAYDPVRDFSPVILVYRFPLLLTAHPGLQAESLSDLIRLAKARPGVLLYGSAGNGTPPHVFTELFKFNAGLDIGHVPYKGGPAVTLALLSGDVGISLEAPSQVLSHVRAGKLKPLAVTGEQRIAALPDTPTFSESGVPGIGLTWTAVLAPAGTPRERILRLNSTIGRTLESPELRAAYEKAGVTPWGGTPEDLARLIAEEIPRWRELVKKAGIRPG